MLGGLHFAEDKDDLNYTARKLQEARKQRGLIINKEKSDYMIFGNNEKEELLPEDDCVSGVGKCKCVGVLSSKNGSSNAARIIDETKVETLLSLNSILCDKNLRKKSF
jgi:hypothetical protein